jgi:hypothetical protein
MSVLAQERNIRVVCPRAVVAELEEPTQEAGPIALEMNRLPVIDGMLEELFKQLLAVGVKVAQQNVVARGAHVLNQ